MRVRIGTKLMGGFGLLLLFVVALAGVVQVQSSVVADQTHDTFSTSVPAVELGLQIQGEIHHVLSMHRGYMILGLSALSDERLETWSSIDAAAAKMDAIAGTWEDPQLQDAWQSCQKTLRELRTAQDRIAEIAHTAEDHPADALFYTDAAPYGEAILDNLQAILALEADLPASAERKELVRRIAAAEGHLLKSRYAIAQYLASGNESDLARVDSCVSACQVSVDHLMTMTGLFTTDQQRYFDDYLNARAEFLALANQAVSVRSNPGFCVSEDICLNNVTPLAAEADALISEIVEASTIAKSESIARTEAAASTMMMLVLGTTIGAILIGAGISFFLSRQIISALKSVTTFTSELARKNLAIEPLTLRTGDEFEELSASVNEMHASFRSVINDVTMTAQEVAGAATQICASSEEIANGVGGQTQQVEQISAAITQMSSSVREVADQSDSASANAASSRDLATKGGEVVEQTISGMNSINDAVTGSAASVGELGKRSEQIGAIINVINDIAEQTNLLALNAAIEAARAGEHGRGFAVVADEVRKLAERTQEATEEVSQSVKAIQTETATAVERMERGTDEVRRGVELAGSAGESLRSIVTGTEHVTSMIREIASAAEEQARASDDVTRGITEIGEAARSANRGTQEASSAANQLSMKAEELRALVAQFSI